MIRREKVRPEVVTVTPSGLAKLIDDLYDYECGSLSCRNVELSIRPSRWKADQFDVHLSSEYTEVLLNRLPRLTLQDVYGDKT